MSWLVQHNRADCGLNLSKMAAILPAPICQRPLGVPIFIKRLYNEYEYGRPLHLYEDNAQSACHSSTWTGKSMSDEYKKWDNTIIATSVVVNFCNMGPSFVMLETNVAFSISQSFHVHYSTQYSSFVERSMFKEAPDTLESAYCFNCGHRTYG
uniref:Uncharacterized protein n=1 Tax=Glossina pallidipes TaxID=7398 RepID=A0A1A9ZMC2_GLOPL